MAPCEHEGVRLCSPDEVLDAGERQDVQRSRIGAGDGPGVRRVRSHQGVAAEATGKDPGELATELHEERVGTRAAREALDTGERLTVQCAGIRPGKGPAVRRIRADQSVRAGTALENPARASAGRKLEGVLASAAGQVLNLEEAHAGHDSGVGTCEVPDAVDVAPHERIATRAPEEGDRERGGKTRCDRESVVPIATGDDDLGGPIASLLGHDGPRGVVDRLKGLGEVVDPKRQVVRGVRHAHRERHQPVGRQEETRLQRLHVNGAPLLPRSVSALPPRRGGRAIVEQPLRQATHEGVVP